MNKLDRLQDMFFKDLKSYNNTNFRTLVRTDLDSPVNMAVVHKAFSSVVTRYFIFREKHEGELTEAEFNLLYFQLKIDLISQYFSQYPESDVSTLKSFQSQIREYNTRNLNATEQVA